MTIWRFSERCSSPQGPSLHRASPMGSRLCHTGGMVDSRISSSAPEDAYDHCFPLCLQPRFPGSVQNIINFSWLAFHGSESPGADAAVPAPSLALRDLSSPIPPGGSQFMGVFLLAWSCAHWRCAPVRAYLCTREPGIGFLGHTG